ncbi:MAG: hypothetical protein GY704_08080, partial [Phycisphaeraceae bacterium]|nr:hypothetical protein [Phycisphaeraceae bacterium]
DGILALSGAYTYVLQSVRNGLESKGTSNAVTVKFEIPFDMTVRSLTRDPDVATIVIGPRQGGPRPSRFAAKEFRVRVGEIAGARDQWFDYDTGYVFRTVSAVSRSITERVQVPEFTPEGTRARNAAGEPLFKPFNLKRSIIRLVICLTKDGAEDLERDVPR